MRSAVSSFSFLFISMFFSVFNTASAMIPYSERFEKWVNEYKIRFTSEHHMYEILNKWITNHNFIEYTNSLNLSYTLGHNQFSGMDEFDFQKYIMNNQFLFNHGEVYTHYLRSGEYVVNLPNYVDWVKEGAVTPVKDQGQCGSCWSFSTTGAIEGAFFIKNGTLVSFSEQQLVDCDNFKHGGKDHGCNGGLMDNAFNWVSKNGGLCTENDYPYISGDGQTEDCKTTCHVIGPSKVISYVDVTPNDDAAMMSALSKQPISVAIEADQREFQLYKSGVFTGKCGVNLDHGVLLVGYGTDSVTGENFYKIKNSWGNTWGENGYIRIGRGTEYNGGQGQCGVLLEGSYPVL